MSDCNCGCGTDGGGLGCSCNANALSRCDSSAFDSSCTDEGQGYPICVIKKCALPVYTPIPECFGVWNGTEWMLDCNSSSV